MSKRDYSLKGVKPFLFSNSNSNSAMSEEKTKIPWGKLLKLFLEFVVAAITALLASFTGKAAGLW